MLRPAVKLVEIRQQKRRVPAGMKSTLPSTGSAGADHRPETMSAKNSPGSGDDQTIATEGGRAELSLRTPAGAPARLSSPLDQCLPEDDGGGV